MFTTKSEGNKKYAKEYNLGISTTPDPSILKPVDFAKGYEIAEPIIDGNRAIIRGWNDAAKKNKTLVGRTIAEGHGDGYGIYVVVKENKKTLKLEVCRGIGDDWTPWGDECSINKQQALDCYLRESPFKGMGPVEA
jgi:hypothetical protein